MIRKLQFRFVLISMLSLLLVFAVILTGMNVLNYRSVVKDADRVLTLLSENEGRFPGFGGGPPGKLPQGMSPELPYESRYFTVTVDAQTKNIIRVDTGRIAAINTEHAIRYSRLALEKRQAKGFLDNLRYIRANDGDAVRLIFLDCGRQLDSGRNFLFASLAISLIGYVLVFLLVLFFSNRIVRPLSESYEKQKRFITDAGHELKTPLTIICADLDVLEMEHGKTEWSEDIRLQANRLSSLTADLVFLARMEEDGSTLPMIECPLSDLVAETAQSFHAPAQAHGKAFTTAIAPLLTLRCNEKSLRQLVSILLDNAMKYSPDGGRIHLSLEKQGKALVLCVKNDASSTLSPEQLPLLFDRFYRGDPARASEGHGIGLSIAAAIAAAHGGRISADQPSPNTLRITVIFPLTR